MFQDEARFGRISDPMRCWVPRGTRPEAPRQFVREYTHAFAAVAPHDGTLTTLVLPGTDTEMMSIFLEEVSIRHSNEFILMIMDGAGWHKARDLRVPKNIKLAFLPPYSPQLNPVENIWEEIREKWFGNKVFKDLDAVETTLIEALASLESNSKRVLGITGFPWIISSNLNAT